jgi:hypothetical protein
MLLANYTIDGTKIKEPILKNLSKKAIPKLFGQSLQRAYNGADKKRTKSSAGKS